MTRSRARDVIAAEDTRGVPAHCYRDIRGGNADLLRYHEHNERERGAELLDELERGAVGGARAATPARR